MCLPNFERFEQIEESSSLTGYRNWRLLIKNPTTLVSENQDYKWDKIIEGPHEIKDINSGIYAYYNDYNDYNYNDYNYNNYYYYNYYYNNYNNYYYNIGGIIKQWGKVAIHKDGYRSEYAKINTLFCIRKLDAIGPEEFLDWIDGFNTIIYKLASKYEAKTITWQDFKERQV